MYVTSWPLTVDTAVTTLTLWLVVVNTAWVLLLGSSLDAVLLLVGSELRGELEASLFVCEVWVVCDADEGAAEVGVGEEVGVLDAEEA